MVDPRDSAGRQIHDPDLAGGLLVADEGSLAGSLARVAILGHVIGNPGQSSVLGLMPEAEGHSLAVRRHPEAADAPVGLDKEGLRRVHLGRVRRRRPTARPSRRVLLKDLEQDALLPLEELPLALGGLLLGLMALANIGELCDRAGGGVHPKQVVVPDEVDPLAVARDAHRRQPTRERGQQPLSARAYLEQVEVARVGEGAPGSILRVDGAEARLDALRFLVGQPLGLSTAAAHAIQTLPFIVRPLPDEVEGPAVG